MKMKVKLNFVLFLYPIFYHFFVSFILHFLILTSSIIHTHQFFPVFVHSIFVILSLSREKIVLFLIRYFFDSFYRFVFVFNSIILNLIIHFYSVLKVNKIIYFYYLRNKNILKTFKIN